MAYLTTIPAAGNKLSVDQPQIKENFSVADTSFGIDHAAFTDTSGDTGKHKQVTVYGKNVPAAPTDPESVIYTDSGVASTNAFLNFINESGIFPLSSIRAFGVWNGVTASTSPVTPLTKFNVASIAAVKTSPGGIDIITYTITLTANSLGSADALIVPVFFSTLTASVSFSTPDVGISNTASVITLVTRSLASRRVGFVAIQA